jgi:hypothetical protein
MRRSLKAPSRRITIHRIKSSATYEVAEVAKLLGVHRNTVRRWLADGLTPLDDRRPTLILGAVLAAFLRAKRADRRTPCGPGEFYCFRCRTPRRPFGGLVDVRHRTEKISRLSGLCECCDTPIHRTARRSDLPKLTALFDLQTMAEERLEERSAPKLNGDSTER